MGIIQTTILTLEQKKSLFELWNSEYPERIGYDGMSEFDSYLNGFSEINHFLLVDNQIQLMGWAFAFVRDDEDWFGIIVDSKVHGKGYGTLLLNELKKIKPLLNGWAIDHQNELKRNKEMYLSPLKFYTKNGFILNKNIRFENDKVSAVKIRWERE